MPFQIQHLTVRDLSLRLLSWSAEASTPASGLTILLVHGFADGADSWAPIATELSAAGHQVFAPDLRGFGGSDRVGPGGYYHFPDYIADLDGLLHRLPPGRLGLVGHSMGGTVATLLAGSRPGRFERVALLEGLGPPDNDLAHTPDRYARWLDDLRRPRADRPMTPAEALDRLCLQHPSLPRPLLATKLPYLTREVAPGQLVWHFDPLHRTTAPVPFLAANYAAFASRIRCPVLLVDGGPEGFHPPDEAARVAAFPDARVATIEGGGHMMHWSRPEALARALVGFFAGG
jgi:pimeloyl-ACP methyl ester carboxylesterase